MASAEPEELRELRKRVKRLERERDILKQCTAVFVREAETRGHARPDGASATRRN